MPVIPASENQVSPCRPRGSTMNAAASDPGAEPKLPPPGTGLRQPARAGGGKARDPRVFRMEDRRAYSRHHGAGQFASGGTGVLVLATRKEPM
jgi:hypothetical protein